MIKILFDVNPLVSSRKSGVGYYAERLLIALATEYPEDIQITGHYFNFMGKKDVSLPDLPNVEYRCTKLFPSKLINILRRTGIELPIEFFVGGKPDFIIYPNFVGFRSVRKTPSAVAVHDLGYLECPEYLLPGNRKFLERYVPKAIKRSRFVITISEATKAAIVRHYQTDNNKFVITPIPPPSVIINEQKPQDIPDKFILFVSTLEPRKNFIGLVRGYIKLPSELRKNYSLVLAGGPGWNVEADMAEIQALQQAGESIIVTGYISEEEKAWLLKHASLLVLPSHYEGFGMPILEAMKEGTPTAVSDITVFHEVSGDASLFFNHEDPKSVAGAIQEIIKDKNVRDKLVSKGYDRVKKLDWDLIAEEVYKRIVAETKLK